MRDRHMSKEQKDQIIYCLGKLLEELQDADAPRTYWEVIVKMLLEKAPYP